MSSLETPLASVEQRLAALGQALQARDADGIEAEAAALHAALAAAVDHFTRAARSEGGVPPSLRQRLARAGGQVAAQREALARATAALDRAIDVLLPPPAGPAALYGLHGNERLASSGALIA
jgi:hypothetical protein